MKDLIVRTILSWVLFFIPLIPSWFIEATHKGTDFDRYDVLSELYFRLLLMFFGGTWYYVASKLVDKFLGESEIK